MSIVEVHTVPAEVALAPVFAPVVRPGLHRFSVDEYHNLPQPSASNERIELLDGWIIDMSPIGPSHVFIVETLRDILTAIVVSSWHPRAQQPITLATSEPQPDIAVVKGKRSDYRERHPGGADVGLVIEVVSTSLDVDQQVKAPIYAAAGIPEYWIIDIAHRRAEVHRLPSGKVEDGLPGYRERVTVEADGILSVVLEGRELGQIRLADFFD